MDIEEIKSKRETLGQDIMNLISKFEKETGVQVSDVQLYVQNDVSGIIVAKTVEIKIEI